MINFNGGTVALGTSISPLGAYAGYLLLHSGNVWLAACFLALTLASFSISVAMLARFVVNMRRAVHQMHTEVA